MSWILDFAWFCWDFEDIDKLKFWRKSVDESAIGFAAFPVHAISFCHPPYHIITVFLHFSVGLMIEQRYLSRTNSRKCLYRFRLYYIVCYSFNLYKIIYNKIIKTCWQSYEHMIKYRQVKNEPQKQSTRKKFLTITSSCDKIISTKTKKNNKVLRRCKLT